MSNKIEKIVIVGGGSAGWMSASTLISQFPEKQIIVIESPNVPIIGVGESTIGGINKWCNLIGIKDEDFMRFTDASYKLSIQFTNFYRKDSGSFQYPFGIAETSDVPAGRNSWYFKKIKYPETPVSDYASSIFPGMALVNENKMTDNKDGNLKGFVINRDTAYHFDATKFGSWLRDNYCKPKGVTHIQAEVKDTILNDDGIDYLVLDNGEHVTADLFIDCTGFKSMLLAGAMQEPFNSYEHMLPNNSAWATRVPYTDKKQQLKGWTECEAIQNGWVWNIPLWSRIGTGYVYSDKFVSDEDALEEFKQFLKTKDLYRDDLEYKNIKMRVGIHKRLWVKNVCAIGLSAGFIEPLESSGLFTVHEFLLKLVRTLNRGMVSQWDKDAFTSTCVKQFRVFAEFVALHYALSHRDDTPYWVANGKREYSKDIIDQNYIPYSGVNEMTGFVYAVESKYTNFNYGNDVAGSHCVYTGMNYFPTDKASVISANHPAPTEQEFDNMCETMAQILNFKQTNWKASVKDAPILYDYLREKYQEEL
jgi:tryptophan halogenase